ncbi:gamma-glutamyltransferase [Aliikangiella marina]|uniref:Glutathione hydrolase proenzyme n=1 Tax=Aliikangiella marina TaxID=1712262 RepID=A0A545TJY3_9GAMM|nr:gamma-glutamyltransferase [Aliikangiella marina]TQV77471.1 gamma-glutamyltransferase [Aliikangiella marina]
MIKIRLVKLFTSSFLSLGLLINSSTDAQELPLLEFNSVMFPEVATAGMVVSQESRATEVGVKILEQGGNAVDAAIAVSFALAVTLPRAGNIGGGGFMMIYDNQKKEVSALDYREKAPKAAYRDLFLDESLNVDNRKARYSIFSTGVPGTVAGMVEAHNKYGKLPFAKLVEPAIKLAQSTQMTLAMSQSFNARKKYLSRDPASKAIFTKADGSNWKIGDEFQQPRLAETLKLIAETKGRDFYEGITARRIADYFKANNGLITLDDLNSYRAVWREPVSTQYGDYEVFSMPPPSSGGVHLIQLLNIMQNFPIDKAGPNSAFTTHIKTEAMKHAYADRSEYLGDPDFVKVPVKKLIDPKYADSIAKQISLDKVIPTDTIKPGQYLDTESPQTTHFSVMDKDGNIVSNTYTLNFSFGNGKSIPSVGMLLNNEMDDFSAKPGTPNGYGLLGGDANAIAPEKRPLSSMTPVVVLKNDEPWLATGSPGGSRIISIVFNFLINRMVFDMNIAEATIQPRIHHQWYPDRLSVEKGFPKDSAKLLQEMGHNVQFRRPWGSSHSIEFQGGVFMGFADTRRPGASAKGTNKVEEK